MASVQVCHFNDVAGKWHYFDERSKKMVLFQMCHANGTISMKASLPGNKARMLLKQFTRRNQVKRCIASSGNAAVTAHLIE